MTTLAVLALATAQPALAGSPASVRRDRATDRIVLRLADEPATKSMSPVQVQQRQAERVAGLGRPGGPALRHLRETTAGALVVGLPAAMSLAEVSDLAATLAARPGVLWAEPDRRVDAFAEPDPYRGAQWNLLSPGRDGMAAGGANVVNAWQRSTGAGTVIAVIDSGMTAHPDLDGAWLPGFDMVAAGTSRSLAVAGDGDGRDPDPADPGNWCEEADSVYPSTWHGTAVAGIAAARLDNGYGIAGVAPSASILPVRAIGRCGGYMSDVLDAMRWSAGLSVSGIPANPYPARILNVSLGSAVDLTCSSHEQATVDELVAAGVLVVVAAGNDATVALPSPASCRGVFVVAAHARDGTLASYSNQHAAVALTAPGGQGGSEGTAILGSGNAGLTDPGDPLPARAITGTSAAAPHVAAAAALLLARDPSLPLATLRSALLSSARPWPQTSRCSTGDAVGGCGSGMLDADAAVAWLDAALTVTAEGPAGRVAGQTPVELRARAQSARFGAGQLRYQWTQRRGETVVIGDADQAVARITTPRLRDSLAFRVTATDPQGRVAIDEVVVVVNNAPVIDPFDPIVLVPGERLRYPLPAHDPDGDPLIFVVLQGPPGLGIGRADGILHWHPESAGRYPVRIGVSDTEGQPGTSIAFEIDVDPAASVARSQMVDSGGGSGGGGALPAWSALVLLMLWRAGGQRRRRGTGAPPRR